MVGGHAAAHYPVVRLTTETKQVVAKKMATVREKVESIGVAAFIEAVRYPFDYAKHHVMLRCEYVVRIIMDELPADGRSGRAGQDDNDPHSTVRLEKFINRPIGYRY